MSSVTSQSELTTKEIVEQAIQDYHMSILPYLAKGNDGYSETPIGAMQLFDDDTAPSGWLVADGTVYNINDYPFLANHIERVHGSKNYYGGDGTTTFAVPNWQGEFFRASGTNSHTNQGSGGTVGEHQDATEIPDFVIYDNGNILSGGSTSSDIGVSNKDSNISISSPIVRITSSSSISGGRKIFTSRPTNTSLLCCIKAVPAGINYSLEEQEIGTWVDGKPVYQKTISTSWSSMTSDASYQRHLDLSDPIDTPISISAIMYMNGKAIVENGITISDNSTSYSTGVTLNMITGTPQIYWTTGNGITDRPGNLIVTIQYTKTTD